MPSTDALLDWRKEPDFAEAVESAFNDAVEEAAKGTLALTESMTKVRGLKGLSKVLAIDKRIQRTLQIAARRIPDRWGERVQPVAETVIFEIGLSTVKSTDGPGTADGQNAKAGQAAADWSKIRESATDAEAAGE